jgi:diguanylate cyclase (GGDEF)-like protein
MQTLLLSIRDAERCQILAAALKHLPVDLVEQPPCEGPSGPSADRPAGGTQSLPEPWTMSPPQLVVVSDLPLPRDAVPPNHPAGTTGVIALGWDGPADVVLPSDATVREIVLACTLLLEIVRLREERSNDQLERQHMLQLANSDPLTGLPNRRAWDEELVRRLARAAAPRPLTLAILDLDHFKAINDSQGHVYGDEVLRSAAQSMLASVRESDFVARLGGDEFGLLLDNCPAAAGVLDRIRHGLALRCAAPGPVVSASAGYASARPVDTPAAIYERADAALRIAKQTGRDRVVGSP